MKFTKLKFAVLALILALSFTFSVPLKASAYIHDQWIYDTGGYITTSRVCTIHQYCTIRESTSYTRWICAVNYCPEVKYIYYETTVTHNMTQ